MIDFDQLFHNAFTLRILECFLLFYFFSAFFDGDFLFG